MKDEKTGVEDACIVEPDEPFESCVWDSGILAGCAIAESGVRKEDCPYWVPVGD